MQLLTLGSLLLCILAANGSPTLDAAACSATTADGYNATSGDCTRMESITAQTCKEGEYNTSVTFDCTGSRVRETLRNLTQSTTRTVAVIPVGTIKVVASVQASNPSAFLDEQGNAVWPGLDLQVIDQSRDARKCIIGYQCQLDEFDESSDSKWALSGNRQVRTYYEDMQVRMTRDQHAPPMLEWFRIDGKTTRELVVVISTRKQDIPEVEFSFRHEGVEPCPANPSSCAACPTYVGCTEGTKPVCNGSSVVTCAAAATTTNVARAPTDVVSSSEENGGAKSGVASSGEETGGAKSGSKKKRRKVSGGAKSAS